MEVESKQINKQQVDRKVVRAGRWRVAKQLYRRDSLRNFPRAIQKQFCVIGSPQCEAPSGSKQKLRESSAHDILAELSRSHLHNILVLLTVNLDALCCQNNKSSTARQSHHRPKPSRQRLHCVYISIIVNTAKQNESNMILVVIDGEIAVCDASLCIMHEKAVGVCLRVHSQDRSVLSKRSSGNNIFVKATVSMILSFKDLTIIEVDSDKIFKNLFS